MGVDQDVFLTGKWKYNSVVVRKAMFGMGDRGSNPEKFFLK